jgi:hypothetical protein
MVALHGCPVFFPGVKGKSIPLQTLIGPEGSRRLRLPDLKTISTWRWQGCQPYAPTAFTPRKYSWYSLVRVSWPQGHSAARKIPMTPSRNLPVCSAVPQPTVPPRATFFPGVFGIMNQWWQYHMNYPDGGLSVHFKKYTSKYSLHSDHPS